MLRQPNTKLAHKDRLRIHDLGINTVHVLAIRGVYPHEYVRVMPEDTHARITSSDEADADFFVRRIDAEEMKHRIEWLTKLPLEVITRPTLLPESTKPLAHFSDEEIDSMAFDAAFVESMAEVPGIDLDELAELFDMEQEGDMRCDN